MASDSANIDNLIQDLGNFGRFQILLTIFISFTRTVAGMSIIVMAFGNYNPGWTCLDNTTMSNGNGTAISSHFNDTNECRLYKACDNVQFKSGISTVVTEWQLVCDMAWITSLIISLQMIGLLLGSFLTGYLGDKIGRKKTLIAVILYHMVVNLITVFSNSWYMFAVMRFLIGIALPTFIFTPIIVKLEFVPHKWRTAMVSIPVLSLGFIVMALSAMATGDWKYLHGIVAVGSFLALLPYFWIPDSLRWLVVNDKMEAAVTVVKNMARMNGKEFDEKEIRAELTKLRRAQSGSVKNNCCQLMVQLMRKGVRYPTFVVGLLCISMSMIYYAISFGVKSLPGNFFTNLIIMASSSVPMVPVVVLISNCAGRKKAIILFLAIATTCLFVIVGLDQGTEGRVKTITILVCVMLTRLAVGGAWDTAVTYTGETFPTTMRSTSIAYTSWIARIGSILAPYLIPSNEETYFISYLIMALCALICSILVLFLPETNGKPLPDVWEKSDLPLEKVSSKDTGDGENEVALLT